ncbi:unnamed protein product [Medioppia subpectinata]|uniref:Winged helix-turn-helix domain-containing protein n=1 Tax=Medioppia subpectinata TaxID=1979941 RepID=A0A7R9KGC7_9ACAR|nr:unnamed protein product [Medioppia subpectinata]CAG2102765.1 unnamed protein product [Medioppia subpectinata]
MIALCPLDNMEMKNNHNDVEERIVMSPIKKEKDYTVLRMERVRAQDMDATDGSDKHIAGGTHTGLVVNKSIDESKMDDCGPPELCLSFKVFLINSETQSHNQENRSLKFWFTPDVSEAHKMGFAQQFFRDLINPTNFPKDYIGFIMKIMKLLQMKYTNIRQIEVELKLVQQLSEPPARPTSKNGVLISIGNECTDDKYYYLRDIQSTPLPYIIHQSKSLTYSEPMAPKPKLIGSVSIDESFLGSIAELSEEKVLELIESSYPNPISLADIANSTQSTEEDVHFHIQELLSKNLIKAISDGLFTRVTQNDTEVKLVRQMPKVVRSEQPTIAIITAQYCEKLAVDAMIDNKDTYVRYKTEGESNVYTLGNIGVHRVVSTKLPTVGHSRAAMIAAGNTTTRLLGTFQCVEYVFLVGIGGGVPHYTDFNRHVRLGDVVVSAPPDVLGEGVRQKPFVYIHCERMKNSPEERVNPIASPNASRDSNSVDNFNFRFWCPPSLELQTIAKEIYEKGSETNDRVWEQYLQEGIDMLHESEPEFIRPAPQTDKLYMSIGTKDVIEMAHPCPSTDAYDPRSHGFPKVHFGAIGSGRMAVKDEQIRQDIASKFGVMAFDSEFDSVVESVFGNRKDKYIFLRGIADYKDGSRKKEWQPYAALSAAAYMKAILCALSPVEDN